LVGTITQNEPSKYCALFFGLACDFDDFAGFETAAAGVTGVVWGKL